MSCPTCGHTLESVGDLAARRILHCPRCGTLRIETYTGVPDWHVETCVPKLVERCRRFEQKGFEIEPSDLWRSLGLTESINLPEDRP